MKKQLPIQIDTCISSECWTFARMAIIQTIDNYEKWLYSHMNIFMDCQEQSVYFGSYNLIHPIEYYRDILDCIEHDIFSIRNIVSFIIKHVNNGEYISVFVRSYNDYDHEMFIYGYDDELKTFDSVSFTGGSGFRQIKLAFSEVAQKFDLFINGLKQSKEKIFSKREYTYLVSTMRPNYEFLSKDYSYDYFKKISYETYGNIISLLPVDEFENHLLPYKYLTGIVCMLGVRDQLVKVQDSEAVVSQLELLAIRKSLYKIAENRRLIKLGMCWYKDQWMITDVELEQIIQNYCNGEVAMEAICGGFLKYEKTRNKRTLKAVIDCLAKQYSTDKLLTGNYILKIRMWHTKNVI